MRKSYGFTLVELAIVMTIIGLLIGGVLKGQELLQNARLTSAASKMKSYSAAVLTFRDVYKALPGDIITPANWIQNCTTSPCNITGNGNGIIGGENAFNSDENATFWLHLAKAGLISGINTSATWASGTYFLNLPATDIGGSLAIINYNQINAWFPEGLYNHNFHGMLPTANGGSYGPHTPTNVMAKYDLKVDDGRPWVGDVTIIWSGCGIAQGATVYDPNNVTMCYGGFRAGF